MPHKTEDTADLKGAYKEFMEKGNDLAFGQVTSPFSEWAVPPFPIDTVPGVVREFAEIESSQSGFDAGGYAICTLMGLSALVDRSARVRISAGYLQPPMMWFGLVSESGEGKSPVLNAGLSFAANIDRDMQRRSSEEREAWKKDLATAKKDKKELPEEPATKQLIVNDTTVEALAVVLKSNERGVVIHSDELSRWVGSMDAYNSGSGQKDRGAYLEGYDGGSKTVNRVTRESSFIKNWAFSVYGGIQPEVLAGMYKKSAASSSDGLYQRIMLYCMQPSGRVNLGMSGSGKQRAVIQAAADKINEWSITGRIAEDKPFFGDDAVVMMEPFMNDMRVLQKNTADPRMSEHLGKYSGFAARLALNLHVIECAFSGVWSREITGDTLSRALRILANLYRHSEAAYNLIGEGSNSRSLMTGVADVILAKGFKQFTYGDLQAHCSGWRGCSDKRTREEAIGLLVERGWLLDVTPVEKSGRGRPPLGSFLVNPKVHEMFKEHADRERIARHERKLAIDRAVVERAAGGLAEAA